MPSPRLPLLGVLLALLGCASCAAAAACGNATVDVVGPGGTVTVGHSGAYATAAAAAEARAGLEAALALATDVLAVKFAVFAIAAAVGTRGTAGEKALAAVSAAVDSHGVPVPVVGLMSGSMMMRDWGKLAALYGSGSRVPVVMARAGATDELSAAVAYVARNWLVLNQTALVYASGTYMGAAALGFAVPAFSSLGAPLVARCDVSAKGVAQCGKEVAQGRSKAVLMALDGPQAAELIGAVASQGLANVMFIATSATTAHELNASLSDSARGAVKATGSTVLLLQHVPMPDHPTLFVARQFRATMAKYQPSAKITHASFEGFVAGRLLTTAVSRALDLRGWPLTRASVLDAIYEDVRTFDIFGLKLGPYGDGQGSETNPQSAGDLCNSGAHEVFMSELDRESWQLLDMPSSSYKFAGCSTPTSNSNKTLLLGISAPDSSHMQRFFGNDQGTALGFRAAVAARNSMTPNNQVSFLSVMGSTLRSNIEFFLNRKAFAIVGLRTKEAPEALKIIKPDTLPLYAPLSLASSMRRPFRRDVINILPSIHQETKAALGYLVQVLNVTSVAIVWQNDTVGDLGRDCVFAARRCLTLPEVMKGKSLEIIEAPYINSVSESYEVIAAQRPKSFLVVGDAITVFDFIARVRPTFKTEPIFVTSETYEDDSSLAKVLDMNVTLVEMYQTAAVVPYTFFPSSDPIRASYESWVSSVDRGATSFRGWLAGVLVAEILRNIPADQEINAKSFLDTIYSKHVFQVEQYTVGPFIDDCKDNGMRCCNQGIDQIFVHKLINRRMTFMPFNMPQSKCGSEFDPPPEDKKDYTAAIVGGAVGGGVLLVSLVVILIVVVVAVRMRRTLSFLNIRKTEIDMGSCIGHGRFGSVYNGDWHGTPVAVRIIRKSDISHDDLQLFKDEIQTMHKLHHPNLLMLMGYCETRTELLIVTEFMARGTLNEFLCKRKAPLSAFSLVAMAFDVVKGLAHLHSSKPPIVHGNLSSHSLMIDAAGAIKVSDFWFSKKRQKVSSASKRSRAACLAPEVISGGDITTATDVFAFGVVLWELFLPPDQYNSLVGSSSSSTPQGSTQSQSQAAAASNAAGMLRSGASGHPDIPRSTPREVVELLCKCWEQMPTRRPSVFQILRNWPVAFAALGAFEVPDVDSAASTPGASSYAPPSIDTCNTYVVPAEDGLVAVLQPPSGDIEMADGAINGFGIDTQ
eukprot:m51a1_g9772 putative protein kinase (1201) ;mRNA; f:1658462-1663122